KLTVGSIVMKYTKNAAHPVRHPARVFVFRKVQSMNDDIDGKERNFSEESQYLQRGYLAPAGGRPGRSSNRSLDKKTLAV
ncbi:MAG: hypothetical protein IJL64_04040, partial [Bacteroidales bacterium]|nr:hypothetical protein [Bacteroidales bacterium]